MHFKADSRPETASEVQQILRLLLSQVLWPDWAGYISVLDQMSQGTHETGLHVLVKTANIGSHLTILQFFPQCPIGFIQSDDPLEDDSHWTCESCIASFPPSFPERVNEEVSTTVNIMERAGAGVEQCERFLLVQSRYEVVCHESDHSWIKTFYACHQGYFILNTP